MSTAVSDKPSYVDFPYPLSTNSHESLNLKYLRNHSNYMATKGILDYFRFAGILIRGILLNFLIFLSVLLLISLLVAFLYGAQLRSLPSWDDLPLANVDSFSNKLRNPSRLIDRVLVNHLSNETKSLLQSQNPNLQDLQKPLLNDIRDLIAGKTPIPKLVNIELYRALRAANTEKLKHRDELKLNIIQQRQLENFNARIDIDLQRLPELSSDDLIVNLTNFLHLPGNQELSTLIDPNLLNIIEDSSEFLKPKSSAETTETKNFELAGWWKRTMKSLTDNSRSHLRRENRLYFEEQYMELRTIADAKRKENTSLWLNSNLPPMPIPYTLTRFFLVFAVIAVLISPIWLVFREIANHRKGSANAGVMAHEGRSKLERWFGAALIVALTLLLFESMPLLVDKFHAFRVSPHANWDAIFASFASISVVILGTAEKIASVFAGAKQKLIMMAVAGLGILLPLLVTLYAIEFLVYAAPISNWAMVIVALLPAVSAVLVFGAMCVGLVKKSFTFVEQLRLAGIFLAALVATIAISFLFTILPEEGPDRNFYLVSIAVVELWFFCKFVDINRTSMHGTFRDRLAAAFLVGHTANSDDSVYQDLKLQELAQHEAGSIAPYHLLNVTLNLQNSKNISIRDRDSDFFIFSKYFIGGDSTGYCRSESMDLVHPNMSLATAMAISAAAASPNMGRSTNPALVALMVLLNIRLGYWLPHPKRLESDISRQGIFGRIKSMAINLKNKLMRIETSSPHRPEYSFNDVFKQELIDIERRWDKLYGDSPDRQLRALYESETPTTKHGLVGIAFSGGGIRSATLNLGIAQALHKRGIFEHIDYMSTVSGGGYLGSSLSALMRGESAIDDSNSHGGKGDNKDSQTKQSRSSLLAHIPESIINGFFRKKPKSKQVTLWSQFSWRVKPYNLIREMLMRLDERSKWVNLSDGGHIENLAVMELLRRRCKLIIIGDGEADPKLTFNGLATLIRYARIDLNIEIEIEPDDIRVDNSQSAIERGTNNISSKHWAFGTITYPDNGSGSEEGYLLYLKSSFTGDEDEVIKEYRHRNPSFPHESTVDQFFSEDQFECYRSLGQHIGEKAIQELASLTPKIDASKLSFDEFEASMYARARVETAMKKAAKHEEAAEKLEKWLKEVSTGLHGFKVTLPEKTKQSLSERLVGSDAFNLSE